MSPSPDRSESRATRDFSEAAGWIVLALGLLAFVAWSATHLGFFTWSIDEGMYLQRARMWAAGFELYEDIWFNHPPLMVVLTRAVFEGFGESVVTGRMVAVAFAVVGLAGVVLIGRELAGWAAGLLAGLMLVLSPLFLGLSRAIMTTLPALCMATFALWLALRYRASGRRGWLVASGLAFGLGLAVKFIGAPVIVPIGLALAWPRRGRDASDAPTRAQEQADADAHPDGAGAGPLDRRDGDRAAPARGSTSLLGDALAMLRPRPVVDVLLWGLVGGAALLLVLVPFGLSALLPQTVGSVVGARGAFGLDAVANIQDVLEWLSEGHQGLAALGVYGLARGVWRDERWWLMVAWLAAAAVAVLLQTPLWSHHLVFFSLPLAVGAGAGLWWALGDLVAAWPAWWRGIVGQGMTLGSRAHAAETTPTVPVAAGASGGPGWLSFGLVSLLVFLFALPVALRRDAETTERGDEDHWRAVAMLRELAAAEDPDLEVTGGAPPGPRYVITDSPMIAFRAGLRVPPNLTDPGAKRFASGDLTLSEVTRDALVYDPVAVVTWNERLAKDSRQRLPRWLADNGWREQATLDEGRERRIWLPPSEPVAVVGALGRPVDWADEVRLLGVSLDGDAVAAGDELALSLYWTRREGPVTGDYTVYTHLLDAGGERRAQQDNPPGRGVRHTDTWLAGEIVVDRYELEVAAEAPPGEHRLRIGLYDAETGEALVLQDAGTLQAEGDAVVVGPIKVRR